MGSAIAPGNVDERTRVFGPGLDQENRCVRVLREAVRENAARRSGADDDVVMGTHARLPSCRASTAEKETTRTVRSAGPRPGPSLLITRASPSRDRGEELTHRTPQPAETGAGAEPEAEGRPGSAQPLPAGAQGRPGSVHLQAENQAEAETTRAGHDQLCEHPVVLEEDHTEGGAALLRSRREHLREFLQQTASRDVVPLAVRVHGIATAPAESQGAADGIVVGEIDVA